MAAPTNVNFIKYGISRSWKNMSFPQNKNEYSYKVLFLIKIYFWFRLFLIFHKIELVQFSILLLGQQGITVNLVINRSSNKNRKDKSHYDSRAWEVPLSYIISNNFALKLLIGTLVLQIKPCFIQTSKWNLFKNQRQYLKKKYISKKMSILKFYDKSIVRSTQLNTKNKVALFNSTINIFKKRDIINYLYFIKDKKKLYHNLIKKYYFTLSNTKVFKNSFLKKKFIKNFKRISKQSDVLSTLQSIKMRKFNNKNFNLKQRKIKYSTFLTTHKKKIKKLWSKYLLSTWFKKYLTKLFNYEFNIKLRYEYLLFNKNLEKENISHVIKTYNQSPTTISFNYKFRASLKLPQFEIRNIDDYIQYNIQLSKYKFFQKYQYSRIESIIYAAVKFRNVQLIVDFLAIKMLNEQKHDTVVEYVVAFLNLLITNSMAFNLNNYRIALIGRINNINRTRKAYFSAVKQKPNKSNFFSTLYFAEAKATASIGMFNIKIWFEYI